MINEFIKKQERKISRVNVTTIELQNLERFKYNEIWGKL